MRKVRKNWQEKLPPEVYVVMVVVTAVTFATLTTGYQVLFTHQRRYPPLAGRSLLKMSAAAFHSLPTFRHTTTYLPVSDCAVP